MAVCHVSKGRWVFGTMKSFASLDISGSMKEEARCMLLLTLKGKHRLIGVIAECLCDFIDYSLESVVKSHTHIL